MNAVNRWSVSVATSIAIFVATVSTAEARVVLDRGMAGARVGMTDAAARKALGTPTSTRRVKNRNGARELRRYYKLSRVKTVARRAGSGPYRVEQIVTRGKQQRTRKGVGVGSTERTLRREHPGISCTTYQSTNGRARDCFTRGSNNSQTAFGVSLKTRKVKSVRITRFAGGDD